MYKKFKADLMDVNTYVFESEDNIVFFDPAESKDLIDYLQGIPLKVNIYVFVTHEHFDHINLINYMRSIRKILVFSSRETSKRMSSPKLNHSRYYSALSKLFSSSFKEIEIPYIEYSTFADKAIKDRTKVYIGNMSIQMVETPGHSPGSSCYIMDDKYLISGDSFLWGGITHCEDRDRYNETFDNVISKFSNYLVLPGHGEKYYLHQMLGGE